MKFANNYLFCICYFFICICKIIIFEEIFNKKLNYNNILFVHMTSNVNFPLIKRNMYIYIYI